MDEHPSARLVLPTGNTPRPVYRQVAETIDFSRSEFFLLDEFGLPDGDPARCDQMIHRALVSRLVARPMSVHTLDPRTSDLTAECLRYQQLVEARPIDLTLLGLGANGHLGLNEPGTAVDAPTRQVWLEPSTVEGADRYGARVHPDWGLTLGMAQILGSREIWLLVTGAGKAEILAQMLEGPMGPEVPASFLRTHPNTTVFADEPAASRLANR